MVEVERVEVSMVLDFFCHAFTGENPLLYCGLSYLFFQLYQNQLTDSECSDIIQDTLLHIGEVEILHLHGFQDVKKCESNSAEIAPGSQGSTE